MSNNDTQEKLKNLLEVSRKLSDGGEPSDKNLFEMANLKEYRHSAILGYLLDRKEHGKRLHLKSFCRRLLGDRMSDGALSVHDDATISCEKRVVCGQNGKRPIDILVETTGFALIIENKCRGALDQEAQISDYWKGVEQLDPQKSIYVLYLPSMNSFSAPSDKSLGDLKDRFGIGGDLAGHLMTYSYRDLVLPWLKEDVLPNISFGSGILVDSLRCYIDLLEGMFAIGTDDRDKRRKVYANFVKWINPTEQANSTDLWKLVSEYLDDIDEVLGNKAQVAVSENEANMLGGLQSKLWGIRGVLRERDPLLDPPNLSYEVYWMLRKNPTPFASQYIRSALESGLFFQSGRKQSTWDSVEYKGHWLECWFHVDEFVKYCRGGSCGAILTFGIGGMSEDDCQQLKAADSEVRYRKDSRWLTISVVNEKFKDAKGEAGGEMLWKIAETVAGEAGKFSDLVRREFENEIAI